MGSDRTRPARSPASPPASPASSTPGEAPPEGAADLPEDALGDRPPDAAEARRMLAEVIEAIAAESDEVVRSWTQQSVRRLLDAWVDAGGTLALSPTEIENATLEAATLASSDAVAGFDAVRGADPLTPGAAGPLDVLRHLHRHPTRVLRAAGVGEVQRDPFEERHFPDDVFGLRIHSFRDSFGDVRGGDRLAELHMRWGVAKAAVLRSERGSLFD